MSLQKKPPYRNQEYLDFVRSLPCCTPDGWCTPQDTVVYHHTTKKGPDNETIPLCYYHHILGVHWYGVKTFEVRHGVKIKDLIKQTQGKWEEE